MVYSSKENEKIKEIKKLHKSKYRNIHEKFIVETEHLVLEANEAGLIDYLVVEEGAYIDIEKPKLIVSKEVMKYLSKLESPSKFLAVCDKKEYDETYGNKILVADAIQDPGNLGTIIRSALAFGFDTVIVSEDSVDVYNEKVIRATQGAFFHINIVDMMVTEELDELKENGYKLFGSKVEGGKEIKEVTTPEKLAIIVGNEGRGVKEEILEICDEHVYIETAPNTESLNVGVAASILMYELRS